MWKFFTECGGDFLPMVAFRKNQHNFMFCDHFCTNLTIFGQRFPGNNEYIHSMGASSFLLSDKSVSWNRIFGHPEWNNCSKFIFNHNLTHFCMAILILGTRVSANRSHTNLNIMYYVVQTFRISPAISTQAQIKYVHWMNECIFIFSPPQFFQSIHSTLC